ETLPQTYAALLNDTIRERPPDMTVCMHLCRGNFAGAWVAEGGYEPIAELLFNAIGVDGYFLEYDSARAGGFEPLRFLPKGRVAVLGLTPPRAGRSEPREGLRGGLEGARSYAPSGHPALGRRGGSRAALGGIPMAWAGRLASPSSWSRPRATCGGRRDRQ